LHRFEIEARFRGLSRSSRNDCTSQCRHAAISDGSKPRPSFAGRRKKSWKGQRAIEDGRANYRQVWGRSDLSGLGQWSSLIAEAEAEACEWLPDSRLTDQQFHAPDFYRKFFALASSCLRARRLSLGHAHWCAASASRRAETLRQVWAATDRVYGHEQTAKLTEKPTSGQGPTPISNEPS